MQICEWNWLNLPNKLTQDKTKRQMKFQLIKQLSLIFKIQTFH
jgi:hypothetical protein